MPRLRLRIGSLRRLNLPLLRSDPLGFGLMRSGLTAGVSIMLRLDVGCRDQRPQDSGALATATRSHRWGRSQARWVEFSGLFFCFCGARRVFDGTFQAHAFGRGRWNQRGKFSCPSLLEASLKVKRDSTHNQTPGCRPGLKALTRWVLQRSNPRVSAGGPCGAADQLGT
jgi:hypothetical protein